MLTNWLVSTVPACFTKPPSKPIRMVTLAHSRQTLRRLELQFLKSKEKVTFGKRVSEVKSERQSGRRLKRE